MADKRKDSQLSQADQWLNNAIDPSVKDRKEEEEKEEEEKKEESRDEQAG